MLHHYRRVKAADAMFKQVIKLEQNGNAGEALKLCADLVLQYPKQVYYRHKLGTLQIKNGQELNLPDISSAPKMSHNDS